MLLFSAAITFVRDEPSASRISAMTYTCVPSTATGLGWRYSLPRWLRQVSLPEAGAYPMTLPSYLPLARYRVLPPAPSSSGAPGTAPPGRDHRSAPVAPSRAASGSPLAITTPSTATSSSLSP
ncbi:hypothetical protein SMICM304S_01439 [Streptomyces microflavus]